MQALTIRLSSALVRERMDRVVTTLPRLADGRSRPAGRLSGGERQQLALAHASLLDPKLPCIHELSLGLATTVVGELMDIARGLNESGIPCVVEKSLTIVAELCDRAVSLEKSRLPFAGRTADKVAQDDTARAAFFGAS